MNFNELPTHEYMKYVEHATRVQEMGFQTDKSVLQLAEIIYIQEKKSEGDKNNSGR